LRCPIHDRSPFDIGLTRQVGTLVYARVSLANRDMEPEIECFDPSTGKSDGFGELKGGLMMTCSLQLCRQYVHFTLTLNRADTPTRLLAKSPLLPLLATHVPFETAIGLNGRIYLKASSTTETIALVRLVEMVDRGEVGLGENGEGKAEVERVLKELLV
jgi:exosome complex component RRP40